MQATDLRVALFSGNYNYTRDGANQTLNLLVGYLLKQGAAVRVYSPVSRKPAFPPVGDLVGTRSVKMPGGRAEYKLGLAIDARVRADLDAFAPNLVHVSAPDFLNHSAVRYAREKGIPVVASYHTRFETYVKYYGIGFVAPLIVKLQRKFYQSVDEVLAPSQMMGEILREWGVTTPVTRWSRGVNHDRFNPSRRSLEWRRSLGIGDDEIAVGFLGRLVKEKGLDVFAKAMHALDARGVPHRTLVVGEGPARDWFAKEIPDAVFAGYVTGDDLGRAVASMDVFFNPSVTETFGNVTLEAMAAGVPVVAARASGAVGLLEEGVTGLIVPPTDIEGYADALQRFCEDEAFRLGAGRAGVAEAAGYKWERINQVVLDTYLRVIERTRAAEPVLEHC
ncbi:glycosyltransferase family 1 protein [Sphingomonas sp. NFR15]|uniref:glycosyltransferase family 4 protein n=1 Tax=Sphingomonas sp. NFR15 TaxID=1566282 RepID=UPI0008901E70|nr:glycosyltransferase family 1 protein [Sphingomonas sp. NFR15]SDA29345.1 Glycosyltransferase involved in cell wall bisynthesis [Sphingomonas sp. NFR15]